MVAIKIGNKSGFFICQRLVSKSLMKSLQIMQRIGVILHMPVASDGHFINLYFYDRPSFQKL